MDCRHRPEHSFRDGSHQPAPGATHQGTRRALQNAIAAAKPADGGTGTGRQSAPGKNGVCMELKESYKQTDFGLIPRDWNFTPLSDLIKEMTDYVASGSFELLRNSVTVSDNYNYALYVRLYDLRLGLGHSSQKYVDKASYTFLSKSNLFGNEVLMANIGANVGETVLMPVLSQPATIAPNMILIR